LHKARTKYDSVGLSAQWGEALFSLSDRPRLPLPAPASYSTAESRG
jgi:hypothetical protein